MNSKSNNVPTSPIYYSLEGASNIDSAMMALTDKQYENTLVALVTENTSLKNQAVELQDKLVELSNYIKEARPWIKDSLDFDHVKMIFDELNKQEWLDKTKDVQWTIHF